jgi:hypothetical protein
MPRDAGEKVSSHGRAGRTVDLALWDTSEGMLHAQFVQKLFRWPRAPGYRAFQTALHTFSGFFEIPLFSFEIHSHHFIERVSKCQPVPSGVFLQRLLTAEPQTNAAPRE